MEGGGASFDARARQADEGSGLQGGSKALQADEVVAMDVAEEAGQGRPSIGLLTKEVDCGAKQLLVSGTESGLYHGGAVGELGEGEPDF